VVREVEDMSKKKASICTMLFAIVLFTLFFGTWFVKSPSGLRLFDLVTGTFSVWWLFERIEKFKHWLLKSEY
jgi:hypothetical protein